MQMLMHILVIESLAKGIFILVALSYIKSPLNFYNAFQNQ